MITITIDGTDAEDVTAIQDKIARAMLAADVGHYVQVLDERGEEEGIRSASPVIEKEHIIIKRK